jgi:hypothetical protein
MQEQTIIRDIIRQLQHIRQISGQPPSTIFADYVALAHATLDALPLHLQEHASGQPLRDFPTDVDPAILVLWQHMRQRYHDRTSDIFTHFARAFGILMHAASSGWNDWLGSIFMTWELSNHWHGQYFTPWPVAQLMAQMTLGDIEALCHERVRTALVHPENSMGQALRNVSIALRQSFRPITTNRDR